jgi:hypothetical protein
MAKPVPSIEEVVGEAFTLMRRRLKAQGIEVTHVIVAMAPDGTGIIRSNVVPGALSELVELADMLKGIGDPPGSTLYRHRQPTLIGRQASVAAKFPSITAGRET